MLITRGSLVRAQLDPPSHIGGLAQLGEHLLCKQGVVGSIPSTSTKTSNLSHRVHSATRRDLGLVFYDHWLFVFFNNLEEVVKNLSVESDAL